MKIMFGVNRRLRHAIKNEKGLTLIELLIAVSIGAMITGIVVFMLNTSLDSYIYMQTEVVLDKTLDDVLMEVVNGGFDRYGIKDALEITSVSPFAVTFVPLWTDSSHEVEYDHTRVGTLGKAPFVLDRKFKEGSPVPLVEVCSKLKGAAKDAWNTRQCVFAVGGMSGNESKEDLVWLKEPCRIYDKIRFIYHPDVEVSPDTAMTIAWKNGKIFRTYAGRTERIPKYSLPNVELTELKFSYFDNANTELAPTEVNIPSITAVRVWVKASLVDKKKNMILYAKEGMLFVNLRNSLTAGAGIIIKKGAKFRMPNSRDVRVFSIANIAGIKEGDIIEILARSDKGGSWQITLNLGIRDGLPVIRRYSVEYPAGNPVYSEEINLTTDLPLNFMTLGGNGRFDYDVDQGSTDNAVDLKGKVELEVKRMDPKGAALFIRP
ncbi:MAG TPA: prepilin-type N-terminal cleavage/methylation domain-containing protein [Candidatus Omnitrophota bacterium]|nr:prepilin-type N-terminal cleavage/methylation domain-containing protein [Candidatus Omnitrophota bacterium]